MSEPRLVLLEAVARRRIVTARYNGTDLRLAPHLLFERHGDLFVGAWNMNKNVRADDEPKIGHFKLVGLGDVTLTEDGFEPLPSFSAELPRAEDRLVLAV